MRRKEAESSHHDKKRRRPARAQLHGPGCDTGRAPGRGPWGPQFRGHPRSLWPERERPLKRGRVTCV